jgi:Type II restriction endonuclease EcoO109I
MEISKKQEILAKSKRWFRDTLSANHIRNAQKLTNPQEFNINPFLSIYLANFLTGNSSPDSIAKALIYPRVLGTSITTSFGTNIQKFTSEVLTSFGSTTSGIDIEFIDQVDGHRKYCQLKSGPNNINKDDVETIAGHFKGVINLARTNNVRLSNDDLIVGVIYGSPADLSSHYRRITDQYHYPVMIGQAFWKGLTGDEHFYTDLIRSMGEVATEADFTAQLNQIITELANSPEVIELSAQSTSELI